MEDRLEQLGSLAFTVREGEKTLGKVGHTLLQKLFYLLQHGEDVAMGYKYELHYYGPYCRDLWSDLNLLDSHKVIQIEPAANGFGYRIGFCEDTTASNELESFVDPRVKEKVGKLLALLGGDGVKALERLATTHYVYAELVRRGKDFGEDTVIEKVRALKPHLDSAEVAQALKTLKDNDLLH